MSVAKFDDKLMLILNIVCGYMKYCKIELYITIVFCRLQFYVSCNSTKKLVNIYIILLFKCGGNSVGVIPWNLGLKSK